MRVRWKDSRTLALRRRLKKQHYEYRRSLTEWTRAPTDPRFPTVGTPQVISSRETYKATLLSL